MLKAKHVLLSAMVGAALGAGATVGAAEIEFVVDGKAYPATLNETTAAANLLSRLPLEVTFENFGSNERITYFDSALPLAGKADHSAPKVGTLAVYEPWGNLCVFRVPFHASRDLFILGEVREDTLKAIVGSGSRKVTIRPAK